MTSTPATSITVAPVVLPVAGSPHTFQVRRIYCVGRNYVDHIREMKEADERDPPFFFQKPTDAIVQDGAIVPYPSATADFQYEVELVAAIGRGGRDISASESEKHIFGYAVGIDLTRRDLQRKAGKRGIAWEMGKSFDQSAPCGAIHPFDEAGAIRKGAITLSVNGATRQKSDISLLIWNVAEIISELSRMYELAPGDLIFTGTPAGVGPLQPGDDIECSVDGLSPLRISIGPR